MSIKTRPATTSVAEAEALVRQRTSEHVAAVEHEVSLDARLSRGDDTVTSLHLTDAAAGIRRAASLLTAAREALAAERAAASKAAASASPDVANAVVELLSKHSINIGLYGFLVEVVDSLPAEPVQMPAIYAIQDKATVHDLHNGTYSGECRLYLVGPVSLVDKVQVIRLGLRDLGRSESVADFDFGSVKRHEYGNGIVAFGTLVECKGLKPEVPTLSGPVEEFRLNGIATYLRSEVRNRAGRWSERGVTIGSGDAGRQSSPVHVRSTELKTTNTTTDADGLTRRTVEMTFSVSSQMLEAELLKDNVTRAVAGLADVFVAGVGRVISAEVTHVAPIPRGREMTARLVLVSRQV